MTTLDIKNAHNERIINQARPAWLIKLIDIVSWWMSFIFVMNSTSFHRKKLININIINLRNIIAKEEHIKEGSDAYVQYKKHLDAIKTDYNVATNAQINTTRNLIKQASSKISTKKQRTTSLDDKPKVPESNENQNEQPIELGEIYPAAAEPQGKNPRRDIEHSKGTATTDDNADQNKQLDDSIIEIHAPSKTHVDLDQEIPIQKTMLILRQTESSFFVNMQNMQNINFKTIIELIQGGYNTSANDITNQSTKKIIEGLFKKCNFNNILYAIKVFIDLMKEQEAPMTDFVLQEKLLDIRDKNQYIYKMFFNPPKEGKQFILHHPLMWRAFKEIDKVNTIKPDAGKILIYLIIMEHLSVSELTIEPPTPDYFDQLTKEDPIKTLLIYYLVKPILAKPILKKLLKNNKFNKEDPKLIAVRSEINKEIQNVINDYEHISQTFNSLEDHTLRLDAEKTVRHSVTDLTNSIHKVPEGSVFDAYVADENAPNKRPFPPASH